jgi:hypothetical protein
VSEAPAFLVLQNLDDDEEKIRQRLINQLRRAQMSNARQQSFYEGSRLVRDLGISIPPHLQNLEAVAAWPETIVDVIDERSDWRGWNTEGDLGLEDIYKDNHLDIEVGQAVLDALICGLGFLTVGTGDEDNDEPEVLVKAESPNRMTATWDPRVRRPSEALTELHDAYRRIEGWRLYLPGQTITTKRVNGRLVVTDRDQHELPRIPVSMMLNRPRTNRSYGRSEITRAVRSMTESGMRTLLGMEVAREFYGTQQRYLMGADESMFVDMDGNRKTMWDAIIGKILALPRDENGETAEVGSFSASSPQPFTELLKTYSQMISSATGVPATHLGFTTDNPTSADAIARADLRLDKRAKRRHRFYDLGLIDLGETAYLWRESELPKPRSVNSLWVDPSTPTPAASADRAVKMIASGVLDPTWDYTMEQFGMNDEDIARVKKERQRTEGRRRLAKIADAARPPATTTTPPETTDVTVAS